MALRKNLLTMALAMLTMVLSLVSASPLPLSQDDPAALGPRQSVCRPTLGCVPFFNAPTWNSFELTIPAPGDPRTQTARSPNGEIEASVWNRADGSAFLVIHLGDSYMLPGHREMQIQARHRNTAITLSRNSIQSSLRVKMDSRLFLLRRFLLGDRAMELGTPLPLLFDGGWIRIYER
ncbi:hypothetical protein CSAL01_09452 [Colletotrichum salicis]|uniref:Uncharacterized protein n=1 Tax=Colletotrichum salicis TaxID=1209931 RepID=A0A135UT62_9PEZI|nr:hypothetical protein CSAL01_09452 [Colletotrichum salicis]